MKKENLKMEIYITYVIKEIVEGELNMNIKKITTYRQENIIHNTIMEEKEEVLVKQTTPRHHNMEDLMLEKYNKLLISLLKNIKEDEVEIVE
uniref:Uncharacterized protein n=1 Tax=Meloidogyne enterolobii TaxID=390850 RepID=A0A6V7X7F4_MELEN|nr:unnamed protein product [Meloidogyne enterolobii]